MWWVKWYLKQAQSEWKIYQHIKNTGNRHLRSCALNSLLRYRHKRKMARKHLMAYRGLDPVGVEVRGC